VHARWADLPPGTRRAIARLLADLVCSPAASRGAQFDPGRLGGSRWAGDTRTWAEIGGVSHVAGATLKQLPSK